MATHGVVTGPIRIRPHATSSQVPGEAPSNARPDSQIHSSACCSPQLWPTIPGQPSRRIVSPSTSSEPSNTASGAGDISFVRGSRAVYIHGFGRWRSGSPPPEKCSDQRAEQSADVAAPSAPSGPNECSPNRIQKAPPLPGGPASTRTARGARRVRSNQVHQSCPVGSPPGGAVTV